MDIEKKIENIRDLTDKRSKEEILKEASAEIKLTSKSKKQYFICIGSSVVLSLAVSFSTETVEIMRGIVDSANGILLAFIAMIFGSYSIFQALMSKDLVVLLINTENNLLKVSNKTFLNLTILYTVGIFVNFILQIILQVLPDDFLLIQNTLVCNALAFLCVVIYLSIHLLLISEVINFAINLYRMFSVYNTLNALETINEESSEEE